LYLVGIVFFLYRLKDVILYVSLFTLGHSVTLLAGVLAGIHANGHVVDAIIGLSVAYKAFENVGGFDKLRFRINPKFAVMAFGLVHGFGLATKMQELALPTNGLAINMVSFNVGVEIGQAAALVVILGALTWWRRRPSFTRQSFAANAALMACGFLLAGYQLGGYAAEQQGVTLAEGATSPLRGAADPYMGDEISFTLAPGQFVEYKYRMDKHATMLYSWHATGDVEYDFHTEPQNTTSSAVVSFEKGVASGRLGSYVAPFDGIHGWYWKNVSGAAVTITLKSTGFYRGPTEYRMDGTRVPRELRRGDYADR
jgi:hypothetical protein